MMKQRYSVKPLRHGKNLAFSEDTCLERESGVEGDPKKSWSWIETEVGAE